MSMKKCTGVSTLILLSLSICAAPAGAGWQTFRTGDGIGSNTLLVGFEDSSGNLWFGSTGFVSWYDGLSWNDISFFEVRAIAEDREGNLWFGGRYGVYRYDGQRRDYYAMEAKTLSIVEDISGNLIFGTENGAYLYDGTDFTAIAELEGREVREAIKDRNGSLWFGTDSGVYERSDGGWGQFTVLDGLVSDDVRTLVEDSSGSLWFGTNRGVSRYGEDGWRTYRTADGLGGEIVPAIAEDRFGNMWFSVSTVGVSRFDGETWKTYTVDDGLASLGVTSIFEDQSGNLWFTTVGGGVSRFDGVEWTNPLIPDKLPQHGVNAILLDSSGIIWFGTAGGVGRYDGSTWLETLKSADGLVNDIVYVIFEDSAGGLWFGTKGGVTRYDGLTWESYTAADGLAGDWITDIAEDHQGNIWFSTIDSGVSRFDGTTWTTYTTADGLAHDRVDEILVDRRGDIWFGTLDGLNRFDGENWETYTTADGLPNKLARAMLEDRNGVLWFGTSRGITRFDGGTWTTFDTEDGLSSDIVHEIMEDRQGALWLGTAGGVSRYDGEVWTKYTTVDGLGYDVVGSLLEDDSGTFWFGHASIREPALTAHQPDLVPPRTVILRTPPALSSSNMQTVEFGDAFGEERGIYYSHSIDGSPWSTWSSDDFWLGAGLPDGIHTFEVRARDVAGNVDSTAATARFEIDATPPLPVISYPAFGDVVSDSVPVLGTSNDPRFMGYRVVVRSVGEDSSETVAESSLPVTDDVLALWNTAAVSDGDYEILLSVTDILGLTGTVLTRVTVDNKAPWAYETAPAIVSPADGGDVYTTDGLVRVYFSPGSFEREAEVRIEELEESDVPDTLSDGAVRALAGYEISWEGSSLVKPAAFELYYDRQEMEFSGDEHLRLYVSDADSSWRLLGGTVDASAMTISAALTRQGLYSVFFEGPAAGGEEGFPALSGLFIAPRVFSPHGGFASRQAAISFTLCRPGPVTVKIYNRAGRLVSEVVSGEQLTAGANLVHWDGRDSGGSIVEDGVYLVTVEVLGKKMVKPLGVVR